MGATDESASRIRQAWDGSQRLTPRQAYAIACTLDVWGDEIKSEWLTAADRRPPLHSIAPFDDLDLRVMMLVGENAAWAAVAAERCHAVADEISGGVLPFDREGCYFDELLMALALREAPDLLTDMPDLFVRLPEQDGSETPEDTGEAGELGDDEWDIVSDGFDDLCRWDEWEVPVMVSHALLPAILLEHHPFRWFDPGPGTGSGYLLKLAAAEPAVAGPISH